MYESIGESSKSDSNYCQSWWFNFERTLQTQTNGMNTTRISQLIDWILVQILEQITKYRIQIYEIPDCEPEENEQIQQINRQLKHSLPLSIISSNEFVEIDGKYVRARIYPWATINTENVAHSDMNKLRTILM